MSIKKHPYFAAAIKLDLLRPKQFCELTGLPPGYATHLKKYAVYSDDNKKIKVRLTIDNIIISNAFKKIDWQSIKYNLEEKNTKNKNTENKNIKTENKNIKNNNKKESQNSKNEIVPTVDTPEDSSKFSIPLYWRTVLNRILDVSEQDQKVTTRMLENMNDNLNSYQNPQNMKYITEAYQKLQNIQKESNYLIHKDVVVFVVGSISEFMLMSCNSLIKKQLKECNATSEQILSLDNKFTELIEFAEKEITQIIGEKIAESKE